MSDSELTSYYILGFLALLVALILLNIYLDWRHTIKSKRRL